MQPSVIVGEISFVQMRMNLALTQMGLSNWRYNDQNCCTGFVFCNLSHRNDLGASGRDLPREMMGCLLQIVKEPLKGLEGIASPFPSPCKKNKVLNPNQFHHFYRGAHPSSPHHGYVLSHKSVVQYI